MHFLKNFHELTKQMHSLKDIPLTIKSIDGIDSSFRFTDPNVPSQHSTPPREAYSKNTIQVPKPKKKFTSTPVHNAVIQFESSGKWPDDIDAIQRIKAAFHNKLSECVQKQLKLVSVATPSFVDVVKNGYVFRLHIGHYREMVLCRESEAVGPLKKEHERRAALLDVDIVNKPLIITCPVDISV